MVLASFYKVYLFIIIEFAFLFITTNTIKKFFISFLVNQRERILQDNKKISAGLLCSDRVKFSYNTEAKGVGEECIKKKKTG